MSSGNTESQQDNTFCGGYIRFDTSYIRQQWEGRLKIGELLTSFLAGVILPGTVYAYGSRFSFFSFVTWTTFINVVIDLFLHLSSIWNIIHPFFKLPELYMCLCGVASFAFLLGSSLIAAVARESGSHGATAASSFFGFMCLIFFIAETFLHFLRYRQNKLRGMTPAAQDDEFAAPSGVV